GSKQQVLESPKHPYTKALLACVPDLAGKKQLKPIDYAWLNQPGLNNSEVPA
ncbi:MAG: ABC transporter ATP-binding protein, partial [Methylophilaceae bacterium]